MNSEAKDPINLIEDMLYAGRSSSNTMALRAYIQAAEPKIRELHRENKSLQYLKTAGIVEIACKNSNVADYCKHWEGRAEKAESQLTAANERIKELITWKVAVVHALELDDDSDGGKYFDDLGELRGMLAEYNHAYNKLADIQNIEDRTKVETIRAEKSEAHAKQLEKCLNTANALYAAQADENDETCRRADEKAESQCSAMREALKEIERGPVTLLVASAIAAHALSTNAGSDYLPPRIWTKMEEALKSAQGKMDMDDNTAGWEYEETVKALAELNDWKAGRGK